MSGSVSYGVGARLQVTGNAQQVLTALGRSLSSLNTRLTALEGRLNKVSSLIGSIGAHTGGITSVTTALSGLSAAARTVSTGTQGATRALNTQTAALARNDAMLVRVQATALSAVRAMRQLSQVPPPPAIPRPPRIGGGGAGGGGGSGGGGRAGMGDRLTEMGRRALIGENVVRSGSRGIGAIFGAAGEVQTMETLQRAQQLPEAAISDVQRAIPGWIAGAPGATSADAMQAFNEARAAVGDENGTNFGPAMQMAPLLLRAARLSALVGGRDTSEGLRPLARFMAIRGSFTNSRGDLDPEQGTRELRALESTMLAFSTREGEGIDPREWENFAKQMGTAGRRMSIEGIIGPMASLMQEVDGFRAGTMLTAFTDQIIGGTMTKQARGRVADLGLIQAPGKAAANARREQEIITSARARGLINEDEEATARARVGTPLPKGATPVIGRALGSVRQDLWVQEVFRPQVERELRRSNPGLKGEALEDAVREKLEDATIDMFDALGFRQTTRRFAMSMLQTREVRSDISNVTRIQEAVRRGEDPAGMFMARSFGGALGNVQGSFMVLLQEIGRSQAVITIMNDMAATLTRWAGAFRSGNFSTLMDSELVRLYSRFQTTAREIERVVAAVGRVVTWFETRGAAIQGFVERFNSWMDAFVAYVDALPGRLWEAIKRSFGFGSDPAAAGAPPGPGAPWTPPTYSDPSGSGFQLNSFVPAPPADRTTTIHVPVSLDGRVLTEVVTRHQGRSLSAPVQSPSFADRRRGAGGGEAVI